VRTVLTLIAVILVTALTAALIAPLFVDWSAQRGLIQAALSRRIGAPVVIAGPIKVRLLPTPYLTLAQVTVGDSRSPAEPSLRSEGMRFEMALGGLLGGQIRFTEVTLDQPVAHFALGGGKSLAVWSAEVAGLARRVALDRIVVRQGRLDIDRAGAAPIAFVDVALDASAKSLVGPFRGSGEASLPQGPRAEFQFATGDIIEAALPIKAEIDGGAGGPRAAFDGKLTLAASGGFEPVYAGAATLTGSLPEWEEGGGAWPWKASGATRIDLHHASLDDLDLRLGPEARALEATGSVEADLGATLDVTARLQSKELNLDALLRREKEESAPPARLWALLDSVAASAPGRGLPLLNLNFAFSTPSVFLGAQTLDQLSLTATDKPGEPITGQFEAGLPGQSHLRLTGALEFGAAAGFRGKLDGQVGDFGSFGNWLAEGQPEWGAKLTALGETLPSELASANGDVEASSVGFSARNLKLALDRSAFTGAMAFTRALGEARARLFVDLHSDGLDVDSLPNLEAGADWLGDVDLALALQATKLRVARVGRTTLDGGSLVVKATKTGTTLSLDRLSLADLGGATIEAQGESSPAGRSAKLRLDAAHLRDFAALVARVAPGKYSRMLVDRADLLSPAKATFEARRDGPALDGAFPLDFLKTEGEAGASSFSLKLSRAPAPVDALAADLTLDAADGAMLLRQLGAKIPAGAAGRGHVVASATGKWENGFDAQLSASLVGADLNWRGRLLPETAAPTDANLFGTATLKADNVLNVLSVFGLAAPNAGVVAPADLSADFVLRGADATLPRVSGTLAGSKLAGNLAWRAPVAAAAIDPDVAVAQAIAGETPAVESAHLSGELSLNKASASVLLALPLGVLGPAKPGARWSDAKLAPALLAPPPTDIWLKIAALDLLDGAPARNFGARLQMDAAKFDLDEIAMDVAGGKASGHLTLRRDGPVAAATGKIALENIGVDRPGLRGRVGGSLDFAGTGGSAAAMMSGLVGQGEIKLAGATVPHLDPGALGRLIVKTDMPEALIDETNITHALGLEFDKQPLAIPDGVAPAALNSGVVRVGPVDIPGATGHATASGDYDLRGFAFEIRALFEEARAGKYWSGAPPSVAASVRGFDVPTRRIDDALLVAGLSAQAITRESERIAALEADLRERAYFNRRFKAENFLDMRAAEIAAFEAEQIRLKNEAERKRVETDLMNAYEEQQKAAAAAAKARDDQLKAEAAARADEQQKAAAAKAREDREKAEAAAKAEAQRNAAAEAAARALLSNSPLPTEPPPPVAHAPPKPDADPTASGLY